MIAYPDTSFLCALYRHQVNSQAAAAHFKTMPEAVHISSLLLYELRQSLRFHVWLHAQNPRQGFGQTECDQALAAVQSDLDTGAVVVVPAEWPEVHQIAERLSRAYTMAGGYRAFEVLHVATAMHLDAREFLSFDDRQRTLARAGGLEAKP